MSAEPYADVGWHLDWMTCQDCGIELDLVPGLTLCLKMCKQETDPEKSHELLSRSPFASLAVNFQAVVHLCKVFFHFWLKEVVG